MRALFQRWFLLVIFPVMLSCHGVDSNPVAIYGVIQYEDKVYDASGFNGFTSWKPVRFTKVDLVGAGGKVLDSTVTDRLGAYSLQGVSSYQYLRVLAQSQDSSHTGIAVKTYSGAVYAIRKNVQTNGANEVEVDINIDLSSTPIAGAFNIADVLGNAARYVSQLSETPLPDLSAFWQPYSSRYGTYYCARDFSTSSCPQGKGIYLLGGYQSGGDTDEYDDDVIYHEVGHFLESVLGILDSPGGRHFITDNDSDIRLAWSEGFGGFFPGAVKSWLAENEPDSLSTPLSLPSSYFVDTSGTYAAISLDMANPSTRYCGSAGDCFMFSTSEVSVANVLSKLNTQFGSQAWWDTLSTYLKYSNRTATLETFWDGWVENRAPANEELAQLRDIFEDRKIYYSADAFELDSLAAISANISACVMVPCAALSRNLYGSQYDLDYVRFDAIAGMGYRVETFDLSNGADTYIRLLDSNYNPVFDQSGNALQNNDRNGTVYCYPFDNPCRVHNDATMLSSQLMFTPSISDSYLIEIKTNPSRPAAAGRYGSYRLKVSLEP